jgi:phage baseplate assembly protein V
MNELIEKLKNKLFLLVGRAVLSAVDNSKKTQRVQVKGLKKETISDISRIQPYGFETYPEESDDAEVVLLFPNGNRDNGIAIIVGNRELRPTDLSKNDVRVWDKHGNAIKLSSDGIVLECVNGNTVEMVSGEVKINGTNLEVLQ